MHMGHFPSQLFLYVCVRHEMPFAETMPVGTRTVHVSLQIKLHALPVTAPQGLQQGDDDTTTP